MSATVVFTERTGGSADDIRSALAAALADRDAAAASALAAAASAASAAGVAAVPFVIDYFASGATTSIPTEREIVLTKGYSTKGIGAARYIYDATVDATYVAANPYSSFVSSNGRGFRLSEGFVTLHMFGARGDGATDQTTRINAWISYLAANGKAGIWSHDTAAWRTQTVAFQSNVQISIDPNTTIEAATGAVRVFQFSAVSNCTVIAGPNVVLDGRSVTSSNVMHIVGSTNIWIQGIYAKGTGSGKDAWYIGNGGAQGYCERIRLINCTGDIAGRNAISIVSCVDFYALGCEFKGAVTAPGAGCDIEQNSFTDVIRRITFEKCRFHDNGKWGVVIEFGTDVTLLDCDVYNNGNGGVGVANGGNALNVGVRRANYEICAITAVDMTTGKLTVSSTANLRPGMIISLAVRGSGVLPTGLTATKYIIYAVSGSDIFLWNTTFSGQITSFSSNGSGTLTSDPEVSEIYFLVYSDDSSGKVLIRGCRIYGNNLTAINGEVYVATSTEVTVENCYITATVAGAYGFNGSYSRKLRVRNNHFISTAATGSAGGIHFGFCSDVIEEGNSVRDFRGTAVDFSNCPYARIGERSLYTNCGVGASPSSMVECSSGSTGRFTGATLRQDANHATTYGCNFSGWTNGYVDGCDFTGCGTSNATGLRSTDTSMVIGRNIMFDGTTQVGRGGTITWSPGAIANAASATRTVTVTGAKVGDLCFPTFSGSLGGCSLTATITATNTATAVISNNTGSSQTPTASSTLNISAMRHMQ